MGKKKISEFAVATPNATDKFLVEQADGTYKSVLASAITTGTTPDGLSSGGAITVGTYGGSGTNNDIRVAPASWYISPSNYSTAINTDFLDIALSSSGLQRYIGLYGTTSNTIVKVEGSEAALATYPTTPANSIVIGYVLVNDAAASTTPDLSGYLLKLDKATQATNTTGTNDTTYVTPLANAVKENIANKSSSYTASSTTTYANTKALVDGLATKQDTLVSGTNIKTINSTSLLGSGDIITGTILGTLAATSGLIPTANGTLNTIAGSANFSNDGADFTSKTSSTVKHQIGTTSTNAMYRLDSVGFRIGTIATIGTTNTAKFEVDGAAYLGSTNTIFGVTSKTTGNYNSSFGAESLSSNVSGSFNTAIGFAAMRQNTTVSNNTALGLSALRVGTGQTYNIGIGASAGYNNNSQNNVFIGTFAGYYETGAFTFHLSQFQGTDSATSISKAMLYGNFNSTISSQLLRLNGGFRIHTSETSTDTAVRVDTVGVKVTTIANIGTSGTAKVDIETSTGYNQLRLRTSYTPTSTADTNGNTGDMAWDDNYIYMKVSTGWKRAALSTF